MSVKASADRTLRVMPRSGCTEGARSMEPTLSTRRRVRVKTSGRLKGCARRMGRLENHHEILTLCSVRLLQPHRIGCIESGHGCKLNAASRHVGVRRPLLAAPGVQHGVNATFQKAQHMDGLVHALRRRGTKRSDLV